MRAHFCAHISGAHIFVRTFPARTFLCAHFRPHISGAHIFVRRFLCAHIFVRAHFCAHISGAHIFCGLGFFLRLRVSRAAVVGLSAPRRGCGRGPLRGPLHGSSLLFRRFVLSSVSFSGHNDYLKIPSVTLLTKSTQYGIH